MSNPAQDLFRRIRSISIDGHGRRPLEPISPAHSATPSIIGSRIDTEESSDELDRLSRRSPSQDSIDSSCSFIRVDVPSFPKTGESENWMNLGAQPSIKEDFNNSSPPSVLDGSIDDALYDQLQEVMAEASNSRQAAFEEAGRRGRAERNAIDTIRKAKASEALYNKELKLRKEIEEALSKEKEELEKMKKQMEEVMEELRIALDQKSLVESQIAESDESVKELEQKIISAVELLQTYKNERDELQIECYNAIKEAEELRTSRADPSTTYLPRFFSEFSFLEIEEATQSFNPSLKIGEGGYGNIYRGVLRHTQVAIKMLHVYSLQGPSEFQQEVNVLSKMRHPNLVTLIGACPEAWILIYEYLPNGSLEDRLSCKDNSPPLSWQSRIRIATELCSAIMFLHSSKPHNIIHGDLKPSNILLDANLVSKLSDFGICRLLSENEFSSNYTTLCCKTDPQGTYAYMDPELLSTGELTPKSDVYSFGIILLRLLTGRQPMGITKEVQNALDKGDLNSLLDPLAGDWPFVQAEQLANLALRCAEMNRRDRPDLGTEVFRILESMRASCGGSFSFRHGLEEHCRPPHYFICPIFQEVMRDPHVAADGFTYEAEALKGWLDSGHDTSPMTNLKLDHSNLVPNRALRSAIQEWMPEI
jgi:serine/threonine protein kinase